MIGRRRLREPDVAGVTGQLATFQGSRDGIAIAQFAARGVNQISATLEIGQGLGVNHVLGFRMQWAIQRHHIADFGQALQAAMVRHAEFLLNLFRQAMPVQVVQLHPERLEQAQYTQADPAGGYRADIHAFQIVRAHHAIGDIPAAFDYPVVRFDVIAHQRQGHHDHVLGDAVAVAVGDFGDRDAALHRRLQIGMIGADAGRYDHLQLGRLGDPLGSHVGGPERLRDDDFGVVQFAVKYAVGAVLAGSNH